MKRFLLIQLILAFVSSFAFGQAKVPKFNDYPVKIARVKKNAPIKLTKGDMSFRTRLRWAAKNMKPNFAGHYILTEWGCGMACRGGVIDALTGRVYRWGFSICCWNLDFHQDEKFEPIDIRLGSRLIVFTGIRNENETDDQRDFHYYKFVRNKFIYLKTIRRGTS